MKASELIKKVQDQPLHIRNRILVATVAVAGIGVIAAWFVSFKQDLKGFTVASSSTTQSVQTSAPHYVSVTAKDGGNGNLRLYFNINNDTGDILNISQLSDINLTLDGKKYTPDKITDRTGNNFVAKALSHTQNFGILEFSNVTGNAGNLTFNNLYFEQSPGTLFLETLPLNVAKLPAPAEIKQ